MSGAASAVSVRGLRKRYGGREVLAGIDLDVAPGETLALLGPNGAGKTTTVEILGGYRSADEGMVAVLGTDPHRGGPAWRARIGLMLQDGGVDPRVTPAEALALFGRFHAQPRGVDELLDLVGLRRVAGTRYRRLSGGEQQRLALALALIGRPELLFLDEPTAGMDPMAKAATRQLLRSLRAEGITILLTTHDLQDVERLADRVAVLLDGRIVAAGSPEAVGGARAALTVRLAEPADARAIETHLRLDRPDAVVTAAGADRRTLTISGTEPDPELVATVSRWLADAGILVVELRVGLASLEDAYLALTGDREALA